MDVHEDGTRKTLPAQAYVDPDVFKAERSAIFARTWQYVGHVCAPRFEVLDETRVRYSWSKPNPNLLPALAAAQPLYLYSPAHYLKQFHQSYANPASMTDMGRQTTQ